MLKSLQKVRQGHTLIVPYVHQPVCQFTKDLVPSIQVRELKEVEKKWEFWTSSSAFHITTPKTRGIVSVPPGESWVIERFGKYSRTLPEGLAYILPFVESVKAVKNTTLCSLGFISTDINAKAGQFDAYGVAYYTIDNAATSAYYKDPETNKVDSERSASRILRKTLANHVSSRSDFNLSRDEKMSVGKVLLDKIQAEAKQLNLGLTFKEVYVRGVFPVAEQVPAKLRAYEYPAVDLDTPGHDLSADYWSEVLTPPYFQKMKFGSDFVPVTPMAPSFEWNIPSPPDFHHFNMQPKVAVAPEEEELLKLGKPAH